MNEPVDKEAKLATNLNQVHNANISHKDYYPMFSRRLLSVKWETELKNMKGNKLELLKDSVNC